jgi:U3 small nucleolar RNA-associated protein 7
MEALIAKGDALKPVVLKSGHRKDKYVGKSGNVTRSKSKENESDKKLDKTLHTLEHRLGLPASLKIIPKSSVPSHKQIRDKKLRAQLVRQSEQKAISKEMIEELEDPLFALEDGGRIEVDGNMERTWRISQTEMAKTVDVESARMRREVKLDGGGYRTRYIRNGR